MIYTNKLNNLNFLHRSIKKINSLTYLSIFGFSFLTLSLNSIMAESISITAETLDWNQEMKNLVSLDTIEMHNPSIGTFTSSEKWSLQKENGSFLALGSTTFVGIDGLQLICTGSLEYDPKTQSIRAYGDSSPLSIEKDGFLFTGKNGKINYQNFQIESFSLAESAQIRINDITASLEEIQFDKNSNSFVFISKDGLISFSQGEITIPIYAKKIELIKDPVSSNVFLKGSGKVHFSIDETAVDQIMDKVTQCIKTLY